jgi:hypothetical protein
MVRIRKIRFQPTQYVFLPSHQITYLYHLILSYRFANKEPHRPLPPDPLLSSRAMDSHAVGFLRRQLHLRTGPRIIRTAPYLPPYPTRATWPPSSTAGATSTSTAHAPFRQPASSPAQSRSCGLTGYPASTLVNLEMPHVAMVCTPSGSSP